MKNNNNNDSDSSELLQTLLEKLIQSMEKAVCEISLLMNDSFRRFSNETDTYEKTIQLAIKATLISNEWVYNI